MLEENSAWQTSEWCPMKLFTRDSGETEATAGFAPQVEDRLGASADEEVLLGSHLEGEDCFEVFLEHRETLVQLHVPETDLSVETARHEASRVVPETHRGDGGRVAGEGDAVEVVAELFADHLFALSSCVLVFSVSLVLFDAHAFGVFFEALSSLLQEDAGDLALRSADQDELHEVVRLYESHQAVVVVDADLQHVRLGLLGRLAPRVADELLGQLCFVAERLARERGLLVGVRVWEAFDEGESLAEGELGVFAGVDLAGGLLDESGPVLVLCGVEAEEELALVDPGDLFGAHPGEEEGGRAAG